jgi:alpha-amylase/alpha-mannosidase (GH57 family)
MGKSICIHAHFYQPPRENPWLETIEYQESAYPYHDWNQRIATECYQPNAAARILDENGRIERIVNNYAGISFNFGPTLLSWLDTEDPATYSRILEADKQSLERFSGHGSALAQGYNHAILPLCNRRDKITQILWGIRDFSSRFGRQPESMWLPETAVDLETLDLIAQMGLRFVILAPSQAKRVRKKSERAWRAIGNQGIDTGMAYEIAVPSGRRLAVFFYNGPISHAVGFEKLLNDGEAFVNRLLGAFPDESERPRIVHIATDGETFGHHHRFGDMALAYALNAIESRKLAHLTNYGEYLEKHPPSHMVEIYENSSWSCPHNIGRWREDCGCSTGAHPGWCQQWRAPLREALDWLRDQLENKYGDSAAPFVKDPWIARDRYIDVILDRSPESVERFLADHRTRELSHEEQVRVLKLLELQRHVMLMYTSCGWFFDDISGIETVQILQYAGRALQLGEELFGDDGGANAMEKSFLNILGKAPSNVPELGNGRNVYQKFVKPAMVNAEKAAGHYAVSSLFQDYEERSRIYSYFVDRRYCKRLQSGRSRMDIGRCSITSEITRESSKLEYAVLHLGDHNVSGGVRKCAGDCPEQEIIGEMGAAFENADLPAVFRLIDEYFGKSVFSLGSLFRDEQRRVLDIILKSTDADLEELNRQAFERTAPLMHYLKNLGLTLPLPFRNVAASVLNSRLQHALQSGEPLERRVLELLEDARFWEVPLDAEGLEFEFRERIETLATASCDHPGDLPALRNLASAVKMAQELPFSVNLFRTQNSYYDLFKNGYPEIKLKAESGDSNAAAWVKEFRALAAKLSLKVE